MSDVDMERALNSYEIGAGMEPNPVLDAARAYLRAAEVVHEDVRKKVGFLYVQEWYVVHHLSFIAVELFLKSFRVTVSYPPVTDDSGPEYELFEHAYNGHNVQLDKLRRDERESLQRYLTESQMNLIDSISSRSNAAHELSRGRYPYETNRSFPLEDAGQKLAEKWLSLAHSLSQYRTSGT